MTTQNRSDTSELGNLLSVAGLSLQNIKNPQGYLIYKKIAIQGNNTQTSIVSLKKVPEQLLELQSISLTQV